jgi:hypothetical protein
MFQLNIFTEKSVKEEVKKIPDSLKGLKNKLETPAEKVDKLIHHEILPEVPGGVTIKPSADFDSVNWKAPDISDVEWGISLQYEVTWEDLVKACGW